MTEQDIATGPGWRVYRSLGRPPLRHVAARLVTGEEGTIDMLEPVTEPVALAVATRIATTARISAQERDDIVAALLRL